MNCFLLTQLLSLLSSLLIYFFTYLYFFENRPVPFPGRKS